MTPKLQRGLGKLFCLLHSLPAGARLTRSDILQGTGWKEATLRTYERKNKLAGFLRRTADGTYEVLLDGPNLTEADIVNALSQVTPEPLQLFAGERLVGEADQYVLQHRMDAGAVGHVWQAKASGGQVVALKILNPRADLLERAHFDDIKRRFRREARNGLKLRHDAVVRTVDVGEHRRHPFSVMELAQRSLKQILATSGPLSVEDSKRVVAACANGLSHLHAHGCVHRDIKPANILEVERGFVVADLGIVRWADFDAAFTSAGTITKDAVQLGSWHHMAPEQHEDAHDITPAADVYALGVTWYEMLTGRTPSPQAFAAGRCPPSCSDREICMFIERMTAFDPRDRPTIAEILAIASGMKR